MIHCQDLVCLCVRVIRRIIGDLDGTICARVRGVDAPSVSVGSLLSTSAQTTSIIIDCVSWAYCVLGLTTSSFLHLLLSLSQSHTQTHTHTISL